MKLKFLDFFLIFLIVFLILSMFSSPDDKKVKEMSNTINVITDNSYTLPVSLKVKIQNDTKNDFIFNTCDNLKIRLEGSSDNLKFDNCKNVIIKSGVTNHIDYSKYFESFKQSGKYSVIFKKDKVDIIAQFEVEYKGFFTKLFTTVFYAPIYNLMIFLLDITNHSLGWSIIIITIILRLVLLVPQHKMMVSQRKMQLIQPKVKEIQDKYKGNNQMLGMELMKLYKEEKVNPMGSCGLLLIQMPLLIVIYYVILEIQDSVNTYYLYSFLEGFNVSSILDKFYNIDLYSMGGMQGLILALIVGVVQYIQIKLSLSYNTEPKKDGLVLEKKTGNEGYNNFMPDPELMNKFMLYVMPIMIAVATFTLHAGLGLYFLVGTLFMIAQQLVVNKILKK